MSTEIRISEVNPGAGPGARRGGKRVDWGWSSAAIGLGFKGCSGKRLLLAGTDLGSYASGMRLTVLMLPPHLSF